MEIHKKKYPDSNKIVGCNILFVYTNNCLLYYIQLFYLNLGIFSYVIPF